jgi:hypothetical protein
MCLARAPWRQSHKAWSSDFQDRQPTLGLCLFFVCFWFLLQFFFAWPAPVVSSFLQPTPCMVFWSSSLLILLCMVIGTKQVLLCLFFLVSVFCCVCTWVRRQSSLFVLLGGSYLNTMTCYTPQSFIFFLLTVCCRWIAGQLPRVTAPIPGMLLNMLNFGPVWVLCLLRT